MTTMTTADTVDVTLTATDRGFNVPVYIERDVFEDCVAWNRGDQARKPFAYPQTAQTRLSDVLTQATFAVACGLGKPGIYSFVVSRVPREGRKWAPRTVNLLAFATRESITITRVS